MPAFRRTDRGKGGLVRFWTEWEFTSKSMVECLRDPQGTCGLSIVDIRYNQRNFTNRNVKCCSLILSWNQNKAWGYHMGMEPLYSKTALYRMFTPSFSDRSHLNNQFVIHTINCACSNRVPTAHATVSPTRPTPLAAPISQTKLPISCLKELDFATLRVSTTQ